jgi:hypothetical protein
VQPVALVPGAFPRAIVPGAGARGKEKRVSAGAEDVLLSRERRRHLWAIQDALAGAEAARVVLAGVVKRVEGQ